MIGKQMSFPTAPAATMVEKPKEQQPKTEGEQPKAEEKKEDSKPKGE
jgi:hypothetical protein